MTKYRRYKNSLERFLASNKGKRYFNFFYSWGASIVIIGALFKINHWKFGTEILVVGMVVEAIIFFISAFDLPAREFKWDRVFPVLNRPTEEEIAEEEGESVEAILSEAESVKSGPAIMKTSVPSSKASQQTGDGGATTIIVGGGGSGSGGFAAGSAGEGVSGGTAGVVGGSINLGTPIDPTETAEVMSASEKYADQLKKMTENMEKFAEVTDSLTKVSDTLLQSFKTVTDNSGGVGSNSHGGYANQMETLSRNIAGLNTIYEIQLKGVSGQISTIEQINAGLDRIKNLYAGSLVDSSIFKNETERMAQQLTELNRVYARLLQAMTSNMNMGTGFSNPNLGNMQQDNQDNK